MGFPKKNGLVTIFFARFLPGAFCIKVSGKTPPTRKAMIRAETRDLPLPFLKKKIYFNENQLFGKGIAL